MNLRDYQDKIICDIKEQFKLNYKKICVCSPCGSGKTLVMAYMARTAVLRGKRTIFLVHRRELITQASRTLTEYGIPHGINGRTNDLIQIASVQTVARRLSKIGIPDLVILDECHHATASTWKKCLEYWSQAYVVGLTATPARLNGQGLGDVFEVMVIGPTARELILQGHLTDYKYYAPPQVADFEGVKITMGDFDGGEIEIRVNKQKVIGDAISHYVKYASGKMAIAYCASVAHSQNTADAFNAQGIRAKHIDGTTPASERDKAIEDFRQGRITILCNVDLIGEGFDCPSMDCVILLRPTQSLTLFIQQACRPLRPDRNNIFKSGIILDHVGNVFRHGLPDAVHEWSLEGVSKRKKSEGGSVGVRVCLGCYMAIKPAPVCPHCSYEFQMSPRQLAVENGTLEEFNAAIAAAEAEDKKQARITVGRARTIADLQEIARERGYKSSWVKIQARLKNIRS